MKCKNCGKKNKDTAEVCSKCGKSLISISFEKPDKIKVGVSSYVLLVLYIIMVVSLGGIISQVKADAGDGDASIEQAANDMNENGDEKSSVSDGEQEKDGTSAVNPTPKPTSKPDESGEYILPQSNRSYLANSDIKGLSKKKLRLARNEIYARHGYIFKADDLNEYFSKKSWYKPKYDANSFDESVFNACEKANIEFLLQAEEEKEGSKGNKNKFADGDYYFNPDEVANFNLSGNILTIQLDEYCCFFRGRYDDFGNIFSCEVSSNCEWRYGNGYDYYELRSYEDLKVCFEIASDKIDEYYYDYDASDIIPAMIIIKNGKVVKVEYRE